MEYSGFIEIGTIVKVHSLHGEVVLQPAFDGFPEEIEVVYLPSDHKQLIPYRIESCIAREKSNRVSFFLKFELVDDRNTAQQLVGRQVFVPENELPDDFDLQETPDMTGWTVTNAEKPFGTVVDFFESPAHWVVEIKYQQETILVPWVDEYIDGLDENNQTIHAKNLDRFL